MGVWLSDNMSWSTHSEKSSTYSSPECLQQLYLSFVSPHLEYAVPVWDPHCSNHVQTLERVQKFALKMCYKAWKDDYDSLLTRSGLQSLNERRKYLKLYYLYQIIHGHFSCTTSPVYRDLKRQLRNSSQHHLYQPYARTWSYQFSFFPHTISLWNSLPFAAHSCD